MHDKKQIRKAHGETVKPLAHGYIKAPDNKRDVLDFDTYVITSAQNNTYVHEPFLNTLKRYCERHKAKLFISTFTYNKNGFQNGTKSDDSLWYDPMIREYISNTDLYLTQWRDLLFCGGLNILPTAVDPLSGLHTYTQNSSGIIPHAKMRMVSLPRMKNMQPRFLYTTGTVTKRNYIQKKAGQKAEIHHTFGALVVKVNKDSGQWHVRQLIADESGGFQDLTTKWFPDKDPERHYRVEAITWGDIHAECRDETVALNSWGNGKSMLNVLKPKYQFVHDITDFKARNKYNINDPYHMYKMHINGTASVENDLKVTVKTLKEMQRSYCKTIVVDSNHHDGIEHWLNTAHRDINKDPENIELFHYLNYKRYNYLKSGSGDLNVYKHALYTSGYNIYPTLLEDIHFMEQDESYIIVPDSSGGGIECGIHGHNGINGSRGSPKAFTTIGIKANTGHTHSAGIVDGVYTAGVSAKLDLGYNKGCTSWSNSHIITYPNGKRTIITIKDGEWR